MKTIPYFLSLCTLATVSLGATIEVDTRTFTGPVVEYFGWDTKGGSETALTVAAAEKHFGTGANLLRIPIFLHAAQKNGRIDESIYEKHLACIQNARHVNPRVKVFASLKLEGPHTFPNWMEDKQPGRIFNHPVRKPNPEFYGRSVVDYIQFMQRHHVAIDYLGLNNEVEGALTPGLYIKTAEIVRRECAVRNIPKEYTSFQFVGAECFSLPASVDYARTLKSSPGFVQILGSHCYYGHKGDRPDEWNKLGAMMNVPMWHTEVHLARGAPITEAIHSLEIVFAAAGRGVSGFIWWGAGGGNTIDHSIKRELIRSMIGGRMIQTNPFFQTQDLKNGIVSQAIRNGNRVTIWIASLSEKDNPVDLKLTGDAVKQIVNGTSWHGMENEITVQNCSSINANIRPDGHNLTITNLPPNSINMLVVDLY